MSRTKHPNDIRYIIGIDFSITNPATAVLNTRTKVETVKSLPTKPATHFKYKQERINHITETVMATLKPIVHYPDQCLIFMEDYAFGAVGRTFDIAETAGVLKYGLWENHHFVMTNLYFVAVSHLKMFCGEKGNAKKDVILKEVYKKWGFDTNDDNSADAYVLMKIGECWLNGSRYTAYQKDVLKKIREYNAKPSLRG